MTIILSLLFLKPIFPIYYFQSLLIFCFEIILLYGSYKINSKITLLDTMISLSLIISTIIKLII
jgi:hypothetical protein